MNPTTRIIFTQGGKGGVGKTEVALSLVSWLQQRGLWAVQSSQVEQSNCH